MPRGKHERDKPGWGKGKHRAPRPANKPCDAGCTGGYFYYQDIHGQRKKEQCGRCHGTGHL